MKALRSALNYFLGVEGRTLQRFNPFCRPVVPVQLVLYILSLVFTLLWIRDLIFHTFIPEYGEISLSAWGFLLLVNFLEALSEAPEDRDEEEW